MSKKVFHDFKIFAVNRGFYKQYKELSRPNQRKEKFIDVVQNFEPIQLIQSEKAFCRWENYRYWREHSVEWAKYCLTNRLWYYKTKTLDYADNYFYDVSDIKKITNNIKK